MVALGLAFGFPHPAVFTLCPALGPGLCDRGGGEGQALREADACACSWGEHACARPLVMDRLA